MKILIMESYKPKTAIIMIRKTYLQPTLSACKVTIELGFALSDPNWGAGTPGGEIDENPYDTEL